MMYIAGSFRQEQGGKTKLKKKKNVISFHTIFIQTQQNHPTPSANHLLLFQHTVIIQSEN